MNTKAKKSGVPDIGNLLGAITSKRDSGELGKTERQHVTPIEMKSQENDKTFAQENVKTNKKKTGRPTTKNKYEIEYARLGVIIPKLLRQKVADALTYERFQTKDGYVIKTLDDIVTLALESLFEK